MSSLSSSATIIVLEIVYGAIVIGIILLARARRKTRWPFKTEDRLLRGPGEHLRQQVAAANEQFMYELAGGFVVTLTAFGSAVTLAATLHAGPATLWFGIAATLAATGVSAWRIHALWHRRADLFLGWFGERVVGEQLQLATVHGWRIFHDLPFRNNGQGFNIDHVAVGPGGVVLVETKTRRKRHARPGFDEHKVYFDGRDLVWPWDEDNHGLEQAERNSVWLTDWIRKEIGERVHVTPYLALPGWYVEKKPARESRLCQVVNPKVLPLILEKQRPVLTEKQVDLIARRLDALCRDVEE